MQTQRPTHNMQMKSQSCWYCWDVNHRFQRIRILFNCMNLAEDGVELMDQSWLIWSLVTGKKQTILLHLNFYPSVVFLIRDTALYWTVCCTDCQSHCDTVTWGYYFGDYTLQKPSVSLLLRTLLTFSALLRWGLTWLWNAEN